MLKIARVSGRSIDPRRVNRSTQNLDSGSVLDPENVLIRSEVPLKEHAHCVVNSLIMQYIVKYFL